MTIPPTMTPSTQMSAGSRIVSSRRANAPIAAGMDPPPIAFTDRERARERSLFALYQVIGQGLEGTSMTSFAHLPEADRWALAFRAGQFAYPSGLAAEGERIWRADPALRARVPDLQALVGLTPAALAPQLGEARAAAVVAYLRAHPEILAAGEGPSSLDAADALLERSLAAYRAGRRGEAAELALTAYLDGFEPVEALVGARDAGLVAEVDRRECGRRTAEVWPPDADVGPAEEEDVACHLSRISRPTRVDSISWPPATGESIRALYATMPALPKQRLAVSFGLIVAASCCRRSRFENPD